MAGDTFYGYVDTPKALLYADPDLDDFGNVMIYRPDSHSSHELPFAQLTTASENWMVGDPAEKPL
jgi:hypothetical protein